MSGIASPLILLLFISMVPVEAVAQAVEARDGNIFFISRDGSRKQLTMLGLDSQPNLWSDGNRVVFVRRTPDLKIETGVPGPRGECCQIDNELWIADVTGAKQPKRILRGHAGIYKIGPDLGLGGFHSPQRSVVKRQDHKFVMNAIFILEAEVRRSHESEAGVVGRITQDNHRVISGLPAPLQPLADQF